MDVVLVVFVLFLLLFRMTVESSALNGAERERARLGAVSKYIAKD